MLSVIKAVTAAENSRFKSGTILFTCILGEMPVHVKQDGTKSTVFPVNPAIAESNGIESGKTYLVDISKTPEMVTYTRNNGEEVTEYQMRITYAAEMTPLELLKAQKELPARRLVGVNFSNEEDPATTEAAKAEAAASAAI